MMIAKTKYYIHPIESIHKVTNPPIEEYDSYTKAIERAGILKKQYNKNMIIRPERIIDIVV